MAVIEPAWALGSALAHGTLSAVAGPVHAHRKDALPQMLAGIASAYAGPVDLARDLESFDVGCQPRIARPDDQSPSSDRPG